MIRTLKGVVRRTARTRLQPKQGKNRQPLQLRSLRGRLFFLSRKALYKTRRFMGIYQKKVRPILSRRKFTTLIKRLRPKR